MSLDSAEGISDIVFTVINLHIAFNVVFPEAVFIIVSFESDTWVTYIVIVVIVREPDPELLIRC